MISKTQRLLSLSTAILMATTAVAVAEPSEELIAAAKKEGMLTTIALPHDWCGYGDVIASFKAKYPEIQVNELNPDAGSADEVEAVKANRPAKLIEETHVAEVRIAALLHDVGHGPFGHFFDDHFLSDFGLTHETLGCHIITHELGNLLRLTDPAGNQTTFAVDNLNRVTSETDALGAIRSFQYDAVGNQTSRTDRNGRIISSTYDSLDRRTGETWVPSGGGSARWPPRRRSGPHPGFHAEKRPRRCSIGQSVPDPG